MLTAFRLTFSKYWLVKTAYMLYNKTQYYIGLYFSGCYLVMYFSIFRNYFKMQKMQGQLTLGIYTMKLFTRCHQRTCVIHLWHNFRYTGTYYRQYCENKKDDEDMLRQLISLYAKSNNVIHTFNHCTVHVKLLSIKSYCASFYCEYLWSNYMSMTFGKLRVAFNNVYRRVLGLPSGPVLDFTQ